MNKNFVRLINFVHGDKSRLYDKIDISREKSTPAYDKYFMLTYNCVHYQLFPDSSSQISYKKALFLCKKGYLRAFRFELWFNIFQ